MFYHASPFAPRHRDPAVAHFPYAELHCHSNFSFLDGASPVEDLVERAVELGLTGLAVTDHLGLYGVVRFASAAEAAGLHPVIGLEIELVDAAAPDPHGIVVPGRRVARRGRVARAGAHRAGRRGPGRRDGDPVAAPSRADPAAGPSIDRQGGPARDRRAAARSAPRAAGARRCGLPESLPDGVPRQHGRDQAGAAVHPGPPRRTRRGSRCAVGVPGRGDRAAAPGGGSRGRAGGGGAVRGGVRRERARRGPAPGRAWRGAAAERRRPATSGFFLELSHHLLPDDDWLVAETASLAADLGLPVVTTNDVHHARPEDRELGDVLTAIAHGRTLDTLADLRRPNGESHLKSGADLASMPPGDAAFARADPATARAWVEGMANAVEVAASCTVDLGFERYRFPGFPVPAGETAFSYLVELCQAGVRRRYHPVSPPVVRQLAHELDVVEKTGLAEFFLICWDLMRFAKSRGIPAQGRGSAADSIVAYALGITRVDPIRHNLLFERFINEGRTTYPDVDIDFSSERREEVIQYVYQRYGPEHTGMVCNLVTYRARSAVREVGYALGFPRPLVDRVAKALETYDSVMVRRDLEADGGFADFFRRPGDERRTTEERGLTTDGATRGAVEARPRRGVAPTRAWRPRRLGRASAASRIGWGNSTFDAVECPDRPARGVPDGPCRLTLRGARAPAPAPVPAPREAAPGASPRGPARHAAPRPCGPRPRRGLARGHILPNEHPRITGQRQAATRPGSSPGLGEVIPAGAWLGTNPAAIGRGVGARWRFGLPSYPPVVVRQEVAAQGTTVSPSRAGPSVTPSRMSLRSDQAATRPGSSPGLGEVIPAGAWLGTKPAEEDGESGLGGGPALRKAIPAVTTESPGAAGMPGSSARVGGRGDGTWAMAAGSKPSIRAGGVSDDKGGPGDSPASVAWLQSGRGTGYGPGSGGGARGAGYEAGTVDGRPIDPESGAVAPPTRRTDRLGRPHRWDPPAPPTHGMGRGERHAGSRRRAGRTRHGPRGNAACRAPAARPSGPPSSAAGGHSSVARVEPEARPQPRGGSTIGMSDWERWLEFCARIDGFPRHLSIHSGGMLVTAAPLIDIAPLERATMKDRVVVQFDKRDVETLKLIKLDLLGLGMLAAIDETLQLIESDCATCIDLDAIPEEIPEVFAMLQAADTVGVFQVESRAQMQTLPKSRPSSLDDLVVEVAIIRPGPIQGNAVHPYLRRKQGLEPVTYLHPSLEPILAETLGVILYQEQVMKVAISVAGFTPADSDGFRRAMGTWRSTAEMEKLHRQFVDGCLRQPGMTEEVAEELFQKVVGIRELRVRQEPRGGVRADGLRIELPQAVLSRPVPGRAHQRPADGLLPGRGPDQRRQAPRGGDPAGRHQRLALQDDDRVGGPARLGHCRRGRGPADARGRGAPRRRRGRADPRGRRDQRAAAARALVRVLQPDGRGARSLGSGGCRRLGRAPRACIS